MKTARLYTHILFAIAGLFLCSCKKEDAFLDVKPNDALSIPSTLKDLSLMLQAENLFSTNDPGLGQIGSDDYYLTATVFNNLTPTELNAHIWAKEIFPAGQSSNDWNQLYNQVYNTNIILDVLPGIPVSTGQQEQANRIKGAALFFRSIAFYNLVQTFAIQYDSATAKTDPGIPLRLSPNVTVRSVRATVQQSYDQILSDLQTALPLLPVTATYVTMPSQTATNALLARVYMAVGNYREALKFASACLVQNSTLVDYNTLTPGASSISTTFIPEEILHTRIPGWTTNLPGRYNAMVDSVIYRSYEDNDLRKTVFFNLQNGLPYFRGSYDYQGYCFSGIATDELYLVRAECSARLGNTATAMKDLNDLLHTRWKKVLVNGTLQSTYTDRIASTPDDALQLILTERRKELLFRGLRWTDLKRLNKDPRFAVTLKRVLNGKEYQLPPNDKRYALPIPDDEVAASQLPQNPR